MKRSLQGFWKWFKTQPDEVPEPKAVPGSSIRRETEAQAHKRPLSRTRKEVPEGIRRSKEAIRFQVGIDFGTSATKIGYQQLGARAQMVRPLLIEHSLRHYPAYCIPSVAAFDKSGRFLLGDEAERYLADKPWDSGLRFPKLVFAGRYEKDFFDSEVDRAFEQNLQAAGSRFSGYLVDHIVAAFVAYSMKHARHALQRIFRNSEIELLFNVCLPIDHVENNAVRPAFEKVLRVSQSVEYNWNSHWSLNDVLDKSREFYEVGGSLPKSEEMRVFLVPESVGAIASYLVSLRVREGIHAVYDIGAGTTDVSIFNICNAGQPNSMAYWYAARNLPMGMQRIERIIAHNIQSSGLRKNGASGVEVAERMIGLTDVNSEVKEHVRQQLYLIWEGARKVWREAYGHLRKQGEWERSKVHVFVCGGGAKLPFVNQIFSQSWMNEGSQNWGPYPTAVLPEPDEYGSLRERVPFERMCVAYGLTTPIPEMPTFLLPSESPNHTPPIRHRASKLTYGFDAADT